MALKYATDTFVRCGLLCHTSLLFWALVATSHTSALHVKLTPWLIEKEMQVLSCKKGHARASSLSWWITLQLWLGCISSYSGTTEDNKGAPQNNRLYCTTGLKPWPRSRSYVFVFSALPHFKWSHKSESGPQRTAGQWRVDPGVFEPAVLTDPAMSHWIELLLAEIQNDVTLMSLIIASGRLWDSAHENTHPEFSCSTLNTHIDKP